MQFSINIYTIFSFTLLLLCCSANAEIFKHVDAQGNVTFTDISTKKNEKPHNVSAPAMTYQATPTAIPSPSSAQENQSQSTTAGYNSLTISSPANDSVIRANGGSFSLQLTAEPILESGTNHQFAILLDGLQHQLSNSTAIVVNNVDRGPHTVQAQILNADNSVLVESEIINIQILRSSILNRNRSKPKR